MPRVYSETRDVGGESKTVGVNWLTREPDFDRADFEAFCAMMDVVLKPGQERVFTPSFSCVAAVQTVARLLNPAVL